MATSFTRLVDYEDSATVFVLRVTFATLASAALLSIASFVATTSEVVLFNNSLVKVDYNNSLYISALSTIINLVAAYHYYGLIKVRTSQSVSKDTELRMDELRHSDWAVTMPLLILKLHAIINNPGHDLLLQTTEFSAFCAFLMIVLGAFSRLGLDELANIRTIGPFTRLTGILCYAMSVLLLILLLIDLCTSYSAVTNTAPIFAFFLVWPGYALVALTSVLFRQRGDTYPKDLAFSKDVAYAALDVFSKAGFAWYTSSAVFGNSGF